MAEHRERPPLFTVRMDPALIDAYLIVTANETDPIGRGASAHARKQILKCIQARRDRLPEDHKAHRLL